MNIYAGVAQLVEQRSPKPQVAGSSPAARASCFSPFFPAFIMVGSLKEFFADVQKEMKKVSWPTREQLRESTVVVVVTCLVITTIVYAIDTAMTLVMKALF
jgi:preprotein translocase subunit SecE